MKKIFVMAALGLSVLLSTTGCVNAVQSDVTCKVTDKDRSTGKDGKSVFRIYTEGGPGCTTFGLADNFFAGNFNSGDMYGKIQVGKTYNLHVAGTRNGFLNWFPEIQRFREVPV